MGRIRGRVSVLVLLESVEGPVGVVERELPRVLRVVGMADGRRVAAHVDDHLGLPTDLPVVERPDPDSHLQVLDLRHFRSSSVFLFPVKKNVQNPDVRNEKCPGLLRRSR